MMPCVEPISFGALVAYWFGELASEAEERVETHVLGCSHCSHQLEELARLGQAVRLAFEQGAVRAVLSAPFVELMKARGMRLREYQLAPGERVSCTITAEDDAVVGRLKASLSGVTRVDVLRLEEHGKTQFRFEDIPFDPAAGEVLFCPSAAALKTMPPQTIHLRLLAIDADGERPLGDYVFVHAPS